jgi:SAM-dependent methyltransferase
MRLVLAHLVYLVASTATESCRDAIESDILAGNLHRARYTAATFSVLHRPRPGGFLTTAVTPASAQQDPRDDALAKECASAWKDLVDELLLRGPDALALIRASHREQPLHADSPIANADEAPACASTPACSWRTPYRSDVTRLCTQEWDACCSSVRDPSVPGCPNPCCILGNGSRAHLRLPALLEIAVRVRLPTGRVLTVEQDGLLRPFDLPTVLWPGGYLLMHWVSDPRQSPLWSGAASPRVIDLGTGTGGAAVAAALSGRGEASVLATDATNRSLALATVNAALAGVPAERFHVAALDWHADADVDNAAASGPFDLVLGGALQFEKWEARLWDVLARLTAPPAAAAPDAASRAAGAAGSVVALAHTVGAIGRPPLAFVELGRLAGGAYGMHTTWSETDSDFEVVVLRRIA